MMKRKVLILTCVVVILGLLGYIGRASLYQGIITLFYNRTREIHITEIEFLSGNLRLRGTLYTPAVLPFQKYPVIVICHGRTPLGVDKILLRKRSMNETVNDQLKNISHIEHTRHRSVMNFLVNLLAGLIAGIPKQ